MATRYFIIAAILQLVWGLVPAASSLVIREIPVELYIALRWSISGVIFFLFLLLRDRWIPSWNIKTLQVAILGILGYALGSFGTLYGLKIGGVANFALMAAFSPVLTSLTAILVLKERPPKSFFLALALSLTGLLTLVFAKYSLTSFRIAFSAAVLIIGAFGLEAIIYMYSKKLKSEFSTFQYIAIAQLSASIFMWILQFSFYHQVGELSALTSTGWIAAVFVSIVSCVLCYSVLYWLLIYVDGHQLSLFEGLHALSAVTCGVLFFGDRLTPWMMIGGVLLLSGLALGSLRKNASIIPENMPN